MKALPKAAALAALGLAAACQVNVDEDAQAKLDNAGDAIEGAAEGVANVAESTAGAVENAADEIGDSVDVNVDLRGDGKNEAAANVH